MKKEILDALYEPFELKARPGPGGKIFKYVPSDDIVDRMNKVFLGNWTTEVIKQEIIEDNILILVRVCVRDPLDPNSIEYCQEGFASQPIARFTQGNKAGQIIDIGNSYKSAMSKAIKTAVTRWGVGLYLEKESESLENAPMVDNNISTGFEAPMIPPTVQNTQTPVTQTMQPQPVNNSTSNPITEPVATPINIPPEAETSVPNIPVDMPAQSPPVANAPVFTDDNTIVTTQAPQTDFNPPVDSLPKSDDTERLTEVQKAAIDNIISVHGKSFEELVSVALERNNDLPQSIDSLSYKDAVKIIQYGNNLNANI